MAMASLGAEGLDQLEGMAPPSQFGFLDGTAQRHEVTKSRPATKVKGESGSQVFEKSLA